MDLVRGLWDFLTQPTEPVPLFPFTKAVANESQTLSTNVIRPIAASTSSSPTSASSRLRSELIGIASAIAIVQVVRWFLHNQQIRQEAERRQKLKEKRTHERIKFLVESLRLTKHPEGGFYRRIFESSWMLTKGDGLRNQVSGTVAVSRPTHHDESQVDPRSFHFPRHLHTSIYFLLTHEEPLSHLHRLPADEQWIHVEGDPLLISHIDPVTNWYSERLLGQIDQQTLDHNRPEETTPHLPTAVSSSVETNFLEPCSTAPIIDVKQQLSLAESSSSAATSVAPLPSLCYPTHVVPGGTWFGARWVERSNFEPGPTVPSSSPMWRQMGRFFSKLFSFDFAGQTADASITSRSGARNSFGYSLVCCVVTPGFEFSDFALMGLHQFEKLNIEQHLLSRLQTAQIGSVEAQQSKIRQVKEMVLHEETRGDAMAVEGQLQSKSQS